MGADREGAEAYGKFKPLGADVREHTLKTRAQYWDAVAAGEKTFEVRRDDRGFQKGDILLLARLDEERSLSFTRDSNGGLSSYARHALTIRARVSWILTGGQFGIEPGYVVMALTDIQPPAS